MRLMAEFRASPRLLRYVELVSEEEGDPSSARRLECLARRKESLRPLLGRLHVLSREFTGVGSYTNFRSDPSLRESELGDQQLSLDGLITIPHVPNGMGAVLMCTGGCPATLEAFTSGDDHWDGTFSGFSIEEPGG